MAIVKINESQLDLTNTNAAIAAKQDIISDLDTIRSGAAAGATAVQPSDMDSALAAKVDKTSSASKVYGTDAQGAQTTYDVDSFGQVDDVKVNGESVVTNKVANVTVPTNNNQLTNGAGYQTASDVSTAISTHNVDETAHDDIRQSIQALNEFTADTIVPTTTNFVPETTYTVDEALQRTANLVGGIEGQIGDINNLIPNQATTSNQLADKAFVNSTIATNSANFRGNWATWSDVPTVATDYPADYTGSKTPTNNDYMVVTDASGYNASKTGTWRFTYVGDWDTDGKSGWSPVYRVGNAFTQAQQDAIDSGITATMVSNYVDPTSQANTAYNKRITAVETDKLDKLYSANKIYGTDSTGAQQAYQAGSNLELRNGLINVIGVQQQIFVMPEATVDLLGSIVQYMGEDSATYTHGVLYQCVPVYGPFTVTSVGIDGVTLNEETFKGSFLYDASISSYTFECTRAGLRQQWLLPNGQSWLGGLMQFGIDYMDRPSVGDTITLTTSVVGYAWEAYAGVSAGNDKIKVVGEKISGVNVVGQYNQTTIPAATAELAGKIVQFNGQGDLLSRYVDGHFYRCEENRTMRSYTLEGDPMKYSTLVVDSWSTLENFMITYDNPVTFIWQGDGRGWVEEESMSMLGTEDLTQYGITYTLESGQTLEVGDKITINFMSSYFWRAITVQNGVEVVYLLPEASMEYVDKVLLFAGDLDAALPEPDALYVPGKLYTCVETYNETTEEFEYEWQALPYQFSLLQYTELPSDPTKVYNGECIQYVGLSQLWDKYAEDVYLETGHIYRATIVDEDDPDFAAVRYVDAYPHQMVYMPDPIAAYEGVITQYVGTTTSNYTNGYYYKCVPTGNMTGPSDKYKKPEDATWSVSIDPSVLATQTTDPNEAQVFEFRSQAEGADWVLKVSDTTWTTVSIADYGITVTGTVPYGSTLKVKYVEPQPEYEWQQVDVQSGGGGAEIIFRDWTEN